MNSHLHPFLRPLVLTLPLTLTLALVTSGGLAAAESAVTQRREDVAGMQGLSLRLPAQLRLQQGSPEALIIEAEPKVLDRIEVLRRDGVVVIQSKAPGFQARHPIVLNLTLRTVRRLHADSAASIQSGPLRSDRLRIELEGSDDLAIERLDVRQLTVRLSGSSGATIAAGEAEIQDVELDGAGDYAAPGLTSRQIRVTAAGSGSASLRATDRVDAVIEGSGDIEVSGPARILPHVDGAGEIVRRP